MNLLDHIVPILLAVFAAGFIRGATGFGFSMAAVTLMSFAISPLTAVMIAQVLQVASAPADLIAFRRDVDWPALGRLSIGALIGVPLGVMTASAVPEEVLRLLLAIILLIGFVLLIAKVSFTPGTKQAIATGAASGLFAGMAAMPSPPVVAYFLGTGQGKASTRASLLMFFCMTACVAISVAVLQGSFQMVALWQGLLALPAMTLGSRLGGILFKKLDERLFRLTALCVFGTLVLSAGAKAIAAFL